MNKENAKDYLPLVQALADGKDVEFRDYAGDWCRAFEINFNQKPETYRIKPESKPRSFNNDELRQLFYDGVVLKKKINCIEFRIGRYSDGALFFENCWHDRENLLNNYEIPPQPARPAGGICGVGVVE